MTRLFTSPTAPPDIRQTLAGSTLITLEMVGKQGAPMVGGVDGRQMTDTERVGAAHEEVELFGGPDLVFGCRHVPDEPPLAGVVVCSPLPYGATSVYLPDARLGRHLARAGIVAHRFHYRGTGHSDGDPAAITLGTMVDDARDALAHLRHRSGVEHVGLVGTAAGATVAALVARDLPGAPVALWRPFEPAAPDHRLMDLLGVGPRPLLVAAAGLAEPGGLADDIAHWRARSFDVETVPPVGPPGGPGIFETTVWWFVRHLAAGDRR
jgi:alpha/beta superfamily hydrolase